MSDLFTGDYKAALRRLLETRSAVVQLERGETMTSGALSGMTTALTGGVITMRRITSGESSVR